VKTKNLKVLFITSVSHKVNQKNLNHFQRVYFLSRHVDLTILSKKKASFAASAKSETRIVHSRIPGKLGVIIFTFVWSIKGTVRDFDVVLTEPSVLGICGYFFKIFSRCKWVVDIWDIPIRCTEQYRFFLKVYCRLIRLLMKLLYKKADYFVVSILPDFELRYFQLPKSKLLLLKNSIWFDQNRYKQSFLLGNSFNILCMRSSYTFDMGLDILAKAFIILSKKISNLSLTIIGHIPEEIKFQVMEITNIKNVKFYEYIEHRQVLQLISYASVCVVPFKDVPDLSQTYPVKVLEYLFCGKPVIASRIAGIMSIIDDGKNGLLFRAGDARDLASKINELYLDEDLRARISNNAKLLHDENNCVTKNKIIINKLNQLVSK
jgi:glycosyltransferase involved in cell wall biosynthesis